MKKRGSGKSLKRQLFETIVCDPVKQLGGGILKEMGRQIFGFETKKKKKQNSSVHNHYHIHQDKKYYRP